MANKKFQISESDVHGRHLTASQDIKAGELILLEKPALVGTSWGTRPCCLNCYRKCAELCKNCNMAPLCKSCERHDSDECSFYENSSWEKDFLIRHFDIVTPVRVLLLSRTNKSFYDDIMQMGGRLHVRDDTSVAKCHQKFITDPLLSKNITTLFPDLNIDFNLLQKLCAILDMISLEVRGARDVTLDSGNDPSFIQRNIYLHPALLVQSCIANSFLTIDAEFNVKLYAGQDIDGGQVITYNNAIVMLSNRERRDQLQKTRHILCQCQRCLDPNELGTNIGLIRCSSCTSGFYYLCECCEFSYTCKDCNHKVSSEKLDAIVEEAKVSLMKCNESSHLHELQEWMIEYSKKLSRNHWLVLDAKQVLVSWLKKECGDEKQASLKLLQRKLDLFEEILPAVRALRPGLSRMLGITLHEHHTSLLQVARKKFNAALINQQEYLKQLVMAESLLKESINNLVFEHKTTPEGQLCKRALIQLKELRQSIQQIAKEMEAEPKKVYKKKNKKNKN